MKSLLKVFFILLLLGMFASSVSATNLVPNAGFENVTGGTIFDNWTGTYNISTVSHTGNYSALISDGGGNAGSSLAISSSTFSTATLGTYEFGAWFSFGLYADITSGWPDDRPGISAVVNPIANVDPTYPNEIVSVPSGVPGLTWELDAATGIYWSEWFLISDIFDVTAPTTTRLNIYVQNYDLDYVGFARIDDVFVNSPAPVPEPSTILLLGSGLIGLAWYARKRKRA